MTGMKKAGTLYLVPAGLGGDVAGLLPQSTQRIVATLTHFVVENPKTARAFLKAVGYPLPLQAAEMQVLDTRTARGALPGLLRPLQGGHDCGLISEAGCPAVADPGAPLIRLAHEAGIRVVPLVGPSSMLLALMASGLNGQRFTFHGYLPVERAPRHLRVLELESISRRTDSTQIFIETPYRNETLFAAIVAACNDETLLSIATDITLESESIHTKTIAQWKKKPPHMERRPTVFLLYRGTS
jgi:16S rRNA (cytidine1402-2'-O)-methyltransferase